MILNLTFIKVYYFVINYENLNPVISSENHNSVIKKSKHGLNEFLTKFIANKSELTNCLNTVFYHLIYMNTAEIAYKLIINFIDVN